MGQPVLHRLWLAVPHDEREKAHEAAGLLDDGRSALAWDNDVRLWYARPGCDIDIVKAYLPDTTLSVSGGDAQAEFHDALTQAGLVVKGLPVMDGKRHRVATVEDKKGKKSGVYRGFLDRRPGGWFINYHRAETEKSITNWKASGHEADPIVRLHLRAAARQSQENAERERAAHYGRQTAKAQVLYDTLPGADPGHPYLVRKGISPTAELRQTQNGALVVPFFNVDSEFRTLQYITPAGDKFLYEDAPKQGHFLVVGGPLLPDGPVLYAEGYATARSLNLATGLPVVMTIDAGNMVAVASVLPTRYPDRPHFFMADLDHGKAVNKGLIMAIQAASSVTQGAAIVPDFTDSEKAQGLTDFNDLHQSRGLEGLRVLVTANIARTLEILREETDKMNLPSEIDPDQPVAVPDESPVLAVPAEPLSVDAEVMSAVPWPVQVDATPIESTAAPLNGVDEMLVDSEDYAAWAAQLETHAVPPQESHPISLAGRLDPAGTAPAPMAVDTEDTAVLMPVSAKVDTPPVLTTQTASEPDTAAMSPPAPESERKDIPPVSQSDNRSAKRPDATSSEQASPIPDAIWVGPPRPHGEAMEPDATLIDKDALLQRLTWEKQGEHAVLYTLDNEPAFIDRGSRLEMAEGASEHDEKVLAALLTAAQYYRGRIELTGSEAFQEKAIALIARHALAVTMKVPAQQAMLEDARKALTTSVPMRDAVTGDSLPASVPASGSVPPLAHSPSTPPVVPPRPDTASRQGHTVAEPARSVATPREPAQPESGISPAIHQSYKAAANGVTGKVLSCGAAPFRFESGQPESVFITLRTREGKQTFWGKELAGVLRETRVQPGRMATLTWQGKEAVTVQVPQKDAQGAVTHFESKTAHRNQWSLTLAGGDTVRTGHDEGMTLAAFDAARFATIQAGLVKELKLELPPPSPPQEGVYWLRQDGQGSQTPGDVLTAARPSMNSGAGEPVISSWSKDGHLDLYLVSSDGPYLQGVVRHHNTYQHVLVTLPGQEGAPPMVFNHITPTGAQLIGCGNGINRSSGQPVPREHIAFKLEGEREVRIGKLDNPASVPPALHARLGFDERWRDENTSPKAAPAAAPKAQPGDPRPV